jgi:hypothetical protein
MSLRDEMLENCCPKKGMSSHSLMGENSGP